MRYTIAAMLAIAACGGGTKEPTADQIAACDAVEETLGVAVEAFVAVNETPPANLDVMLADGFVDATREWLDWYTVNAGTVEANPDGPCA